MTRLAGLSPQTAAFTAEVQEIRRAFAAHAHDLALNLQFLSGQLSAFCGKLDGLFARLALVLHCCDQQPSAEHITHEMADRADSLLRRFIVPHALRFYLDLAGETGILADARSIAGWILAKGIDRLFAVGGAAVGAVAAKPDVTYHSLEDVEGIAALVEAIPAEIDILNHRPARERLRAGNFLTRHRARPACLRRRGPSPRGERVGPASAAVSA